MEEKQLYREKVEIILKGLEERLDYTKSEIVPEEEESIGIKFDHELDVMENDHEELSSILYEIDEVHETAWDNFKAQIQGLVEKFRIKYDFV